MLRRTWLTPHRGLLLLAGLLLMACGGSSTVLAPPTSTPTPAATCAALLPGSGPIDLGSSFVYPIAFPTGSVRTTDMVTTSGVGLFTVHSFDACSPNTSVSAVQTFFTTQLPALPHGWIPATTFPYDGGLMQNCAACWSDPKGGPIYYLAFDTFIDRGNNVVTYHAHYAVFAQDLPSCNSNFTNSPIPGFQFFLSGQPDLPLPPFTLVAPDSASHLRGYDLCSPGTTASISTFMLHELPATGWTQIAGGANPQCFYTDECWSKSSNVISWSVTGFTADDWHIAWHPSGP